MLVKKTIYDPNGLRHDESPEVVDAGVIEVIFRKPDGTAGRVLEYDVDDIQELVVHKRMTEREDR